MAKLYTAIDCFKGNKCALLCDSDFMTNRNFGKIILVANYC